MFACRYTTIGRALAKQDVLIMPASENDVRLPVLKQDVLIMPAAAFHASQ